MPHVNPSRKTAGAAARSFAAGAGQLGDSTGSDKPLPLPGTKPPARDTGSSGRDKAYKGDDDTTEADNLLGAVKSAATDYYAREHRSVHLLDAMNDSDKLFDLLDVDRSGVLSMNELRQFLGEYS